MHKNIIFVPLVIFGTDVIFHWKNIPSCCDCQIFFAILVLVRIALNPAAIVKYFLLCYFW